MNKNLETSYNLAKEQYSALEIDVESALKKLHSISVSLHCWQGDDVTGFENLGGGLGGDGIQATGNYPGKARNPDELRSDLDKAFSLIPEMSGGSPADSLSGTFNVTNLTLAGNIKATFTEVTGSPVVRLTYTATKLPTK